MMTLGADGNVWFTQPQANKIGRITPDGYITEVALPAGECRSESRRAPTKICG